MMVLNSSGTLPVPSPRRSLFEQAPGSHSRRILSANSAERGETHDAKVQGATRQSALTFSGRFMAIHAAWFAPAKLSP